MSRQTNHRNCRRLPYQSIADILGRALGSWPSTIRLCLIAVCITAPILATLLTILAIRG